MNEESKQTLAYAFGSLQGLDWEMAAAFFAGWVKHAVPAELWNEAIVHALAHVAELRCSVRETK